MFEYSKEFIEWIYRLYLDGKVNFKELKRILDAYNKQAQEEIEAELRKIDKNIDVEELAISSMLHSNAKRVALQLKRILTEATKLQKTYKEVAMEIYDGYNSGKGVLRAKKVLPQYLLDAIDKRKFDKRIEQLATKNLRIAYKKIAEYIKEKDEKVLRELLFSAFNEKMRYYAKRIAVTELHRATMRKWAREYLEDKEIEFVRFEMSAAHPKVDICDYYANLDVGYGAGIVKTVIPHKFFHLTQSIKKHVGIAK